MTPPILSSPPGRILIIKPSAIGDVVHALPILNLLRKHWPAATIHWVVTPTCAGLLEGHPLLDGIEIFHRKRLAQSWWNPLALRDLFRFRNQLRRQKFDLVIDLQGLLRSSLIARQTKAPIRIGFANAREGAPMFYTHRVPIESAEVHALDRYLKIVEALGCPIGPVEFPFAHNDADRAEISKKLGDIGPYAVLLPGTNWPTKRWPVEKFAALVKPIRERFNLASVAAGGPDEVELGNQVGADLNLAGQTNLRQLVALLERASLVIANDSGPMHIAAALGTPLVTMFGPTNPIRTGPFGRAESVVRLDIPCSPCYSRKCSHQSCLQWLEISHVLKQAEVEMSRQRTA